jgi:hypothetical protein
MNSTYSGLAYCIECFYLVDIIFLIYLYQRWIYPVDPKRVNEFGQGGDDDNVVPGDNANITTSSSAITQPILTEEKKHQ